jgi:hypothetical protein
LLTVKHVVDDGFERIVGGIQSVAYVPAAECVIEHVVGYNGGSDGPVFNDGTVYVINEAGATVATYRLSSTKPPDKPAPELPAAQAEKTKPFEEWTS